MRLTVNQEYAGAEPAVRGKYMKSKVQTWRRNTKLKVVQAMGSKCQICGYSTCTAALEFHHTTQSDKSVSISKLISNPSNWENIVSELKKCILLCSNCHKEIHYGNTKLPEVYQKFDDNLISKDSISKVQKNEVCPVCGGKKTIEIKLAHINAREN